MNPRIAIAALLFCVLPAAPALAQAPVFLTRWSIPSMPPFGVREIALDAGRNVYAVDLYFLHESTNGGAGLGSWPCTAGPGGCNLTGVAIGPAGQVYLSDQASGQVQEFTGTGTWVRQWTGGGNLAVDAEGNVFCDSGGNRIVKHDPSGAVLAGWDVTGAGRGLAVDGSGNVYALFATSPYVRKYSASGALLAQWGVAGQEPGQFRYEPGAIGVGPDGTVYVSDDFFSSLSPSTAFARIQEFSPDGVYLRGWGEAGGNPGQLLLVHDIAVDSSGDIYVAHGDMVSVFAPAPVPALPIGWGSIKSLYR